MLTLGCATNEILEYPLCAPPTASAAPTHSPARPATASCARARARAGTRWAGMHGTWVAAHEFPCSLWVAPPLGLLNTHYAHPPTASAAPTHSPARPAAASCARARAQALSGVTDAWDFGRGSSFPLLTLGCPTTRALGHTLCAPPTASAAPTHSPTRPAVASCARARARAGTQWGHGCMGLGSRLITSLAHFGLSHH